MERNKEIIKVSIKGIIVNLILVIFKMIVGIIANSIAIILDAVNNLTDAFSAIITIIATKMSGKAPDKEHPYGHGRIEYFASIVIGFIMLIAGLTSLKECIKKVIYLEKATYTKESFIIVGTAIIIKLTFGRYLKKQGIKMNSKCLVATATEAYMDAIVSLTTLIAAIVSLIWNISLESYLGVLIAILIIKSSIDILKEPINSIIGMKVEDELIQKIKNQINSYDEVQETCDLILHDYGPSNLIGSVNIQVPEDMLASQIHNLTRKISEDIRQEFGIYLTIGIYAANEEEKYIKIKRELDKIIKNYKEVLQIHGFYVDEKKKEISFDLIIDFKEEKPEKIKNEILEKIKEKFPKYKYCVILDTELN